MANEIHVCTNPNALRVIMGTLSPHLMSKSMPSQPPNATSTRKKKKKRRDKLNGVVFHSVQLIFSTLESLYHFPQIPPRGRKCKSRTLARFSSTLNSYPNFLKSLHIPKVIREEIKELVFGALPKRERNIRLVEPLWSLSIFGPPYVMFVVLFVLYSRVEGPISPYNVSVGRNKWAWSVNIRSVHTWVCLTVACLDAPHVILACCLDDLPCVKLVF